MSHEVTTKQSTPAVRRLSQLAAGLILTCAATFANAACEYNGIYYEAGTQICFDGWLQECTVADYWSAIGMCQRDSSIDANQPAWSEFSARSSDVRTQLDRVQPVSASQIEQRQVAG